MNEAWHLCIGLSSTFIYDEASLFKYLGPDIL